MVRDSIRKRRFCEGPQCGPVVYAGRANSETRTGEQAAGGSLYGVAKYPAPRFGSRGVVRVAPAPPSRVDDLPVLDVTRLVLLSNVPILPLFLISVLCTSCKVYCVIFRGNGKIMTPPPPPPRSPRGVSPLPKAKPLNPRNRKSGKFWGKLWGSVARKKFSERLARLNLRDLLRQCRKRMEGRGP